MRITSLWTKRPILNRLSYWLYKRYCNEPYYPRGKVKAKVYIGNPDSLALTDRENKVIITYQPDKFIRGIHDWYIFDIEIIKRIK